MTAETGSGVAVVGVGIGANFSKNAFRLLRAPLLLYRALSIVYSRGVGK